MTRIMGDSTSLAAIPLDVQIAAVYDDGHLGVETPAQLEARFPHARYGQVFIDVLGTRPDAQARDWEPGNYPSAQSLSLEAWVIAHNAASGKKDAVVYCDRADVPNVRVATGSQILGTDYFLWVSTLDGTVVAAGPEHLEAAPYTYPGVVACQVKGAKLTGGDWDMSLVYDAGLWLPVPLPPKPVLVTRAEAEAAVSAAVAQLARVAVYVSEG